MTYFVPKRENLLGYLKFLNKYDIINITVDF